MLPLTTAQRDALDLDTVRIARLIALDFASGIIRLTTHPYPVVGVNTWTPGVILALNAWKTVSNQNAAPWSVTLSAVDPTIRTIMTTESIEGRAMTFRRAIIDVSDPNVATLIGDPVAIVERPMNAGEFIRGDRSQDMAWVINGASPWTGKVKGGHRVATHQDQLAYARELTGNPSYVDTAFKDQYSKVGLKWPGNAWVQRS